MMSQPESERTLPRWRRVLNAGLFLVYHSYRGLLFAVFSFPVAASFVISGLILDPSIPASAKVDLLPLIIQHYDRVFSDSLTLAIIMAFAIVLLGPFKYGLVRFSRS